MREKLLLLLLMMAFVLSAGAQTVTIATDRYAVCPGITNSFTAIIANSGPATSYQWQVNGNNTGTNSAAFNSSSLAVQDKVTCIISNTGNATVPSATSNTITMIAGDGSMQPGVVVSQVTTNLCQATFQASPINAGSSPIYRWQVNGVDEGTNSATFIDTHPVANDVVSCIIINPATCAAVNSGTNTIKLTTSQMGINFAVTTSPDDLCENTTTVTFTPHAIPDNHYWYDLYVNDVPTLGGRVFSFGYAPKEGDRVYMVLQNPDPCIGPSQIKSDVITFHVQKKPTIKVTADKDGVCVGTPITFTAEETPLTTPNYQWIVNNLPVTGENKKTFTSRKLQDGDRVTCTVKNLSGCTMPFTAPAVGVTIYSPPVINLPPFIRVGVGKPVQLKPGITGDAATFQWTPSINLSDPAIADPIAKPAVNTTYHLIATSSHGCVSAQASVTIVLYGELQFANAFTPNGDGINDTWDIPSLGDYPDCTVDVYNRYGQTVFHSVGYTKPWDGNTGGQPVPAGTYYFVIDTKKTITGRLTGWVSILR